MKRNGLFLLSFCFFVLPFPSFASVGQEGAAFLDIPVGAGPAAMGSAYSALATNAYAPTWNPGALGFVDSAQLAGQHLSYLESIHYEYAGFALPLGKDLSPDASHPGTLGLAMQYLGSGNVAGTNEQGAAIGDFSNHYTAYTLAYGKPLSRKLSLGFAGKLINAQLDNVSANAYAADLGGLYKATDHLNLAAVVSNLGNKLTFLDQGDSLPLTFRIGAAYEPEKHWLISADGVYQKIEGLTSGHFGLQWQPVDLISLRAGYRTDTLKGLDAMAGVSVGMGLHVWGQEFAYAWVPYGDLGDTQYFSLLLKFGARDEAKRNLIHYQNIKQHRTVKGHRTRDTQHATDEPEYEQLMQLLSDSENHLAQAPSAAGQNR